MFYVCFSKKLICGNGNVITPALVCFLGSLSSWLPF